VGGAVKEVGGGGGEGGEGAGEEAARRGGTCHAGHALMRESVRAAAREGGGALTETEKWLC
jgi:hypothetical protein